jgi:uncharacterized protein (TIGR03086 family)
MTNLDLYKKAGQVTLKFVENIPGNQWEKMSVDSEWTVKDLINHLTSESLWVPELLEGKTIAEVGGKYDGDVLGDDPKSAFKNALEKSTQAFFTEGAMEKTVHLSYGDFTGKSYCGDMATDLLIHGWDVAVSTGQKDNLPEDLVQAVWDLVEPNLKGIQESGMFGAPVEVDENSDLQTKLLAVLGRDRVSLVNKSEELAE